MARTVRDTKLDTREARLRLKLGRRFYRDIGDGLALCYRRTSASYGTWSIRVRASDGRYALRAIGMADDHETADDARVFSYRQAVGRAQDEAKRGIEPFHQLTVADAADKYLKWYQEERKAYAETKASIGAHILPDLGNVPLSALTQAQMQDWLRALARKAPRRRVGLGKKRVVGKKPEGDEAKRARRASANRIFTILRAILNYAFRSNMVRDDKEWRKVEPFKNVDAPIVRFLSADEATRLVNVCPVPFRHLVAGALHTGARYSELANMRVVDLNAHDSNVFIRPGKSGRARNVPLSPEGLKFFKAIAAANAGDELMFTRADGSAWGKSYQIRPLADACAKAKISPAISFHVLRHTYGSALARAGVPLLTISKLLGHADMRITSRHYAHVADRELQSAVSLLPMLNMTSDGKIKAIR